MPRLVANLTESDKKQVDPAKPLENPALWFPSTSSWRSAVVGVNIASSRTFDGFFVTHFLPKAVDPKLSKSTRDMFETD